MFVGMCGIMAWRGVSIQGVPIRASDREDIRNRKRIMENNGPSIDYRSWLIQWGSPGQVAA